MENPKIVPETKRKEQFESKAEVETSASTTPEAVEVEKQVESEAKERAEQRAAQELKQVGTLSSAIAATPTDDANKQSTDNIFIDIPGNTPEEKILHLLNDFPTDKAKQVVDGLEGLHQNNHE